ncbi:hypothetical protein [Hyphomicrobium sp.]|uniref:hypothetical protein n=1 Tax=Hyphomicrobium sp. TaxID=82 RepID=UPI002D78A836|nr:hypothetical protein [Hyphomicrobium sp.]HET6390941.1 hypothetical protein [Hyphomicrobium sp.]
MPPSLRRTQLLDYSVLHSARPEGPAIGALDGREFTEFVRDAFGRLFVYSGVAPRRSDGAFDEEALGPGEFIVPPGLIYRYHGKVRRAA